MDRTLVEQLTAQAERRTFEPGAAIVRQGSRADAFYILISGAVDVVKRVESGKVQLVSSMKAPAFFGEIGLLDEGRRTATVRAAVESPVELLIVPKQAFKEFVDASEMMAEELAAIMQKYRMHDSLVSILGDLSHEEIEGIASHGEIQKFEQGKMVICQDDPARCFYVLTQGRVEVLHQREDGRTYLINFHEPGEYFGEIGLLQNRPRSASVRAADGPVEVLAFDRRVFQEMMGDSLVTETAIAQEMAKRLARQADTQAL